MRLTSKSLEDDFEINVIPLIDVMLTLLMFFVLTTTFENRALLEVALPEASANETNQVKENLVVLINKEGRFFVGANEVLNPSLQTLKASLQSVAGDDRTQPVTIRADALTPHQSVVTAMDALGQLGFSKLSIATTELAEPAKR